MGKDGREYHCATNGGEGSEKKRALKEGEQVGRRVSEAVDGKCVRRAGRLQQAQVSIIPNPVICVS